MKNRIAGRFMVNNAQNELFSSKKTHQKMFIRFDKM